MFDPQFWHPEPSVVQPTPSHTRHRENLKYFPPIFENYGSQQKWPGSNARQIFQFANRWQVLGDLVRTLPMSPFPWLVTISPLPFGSPLPFSPFPSPLYLSILPMPEEICTSIRKSIQTSMRTSIQTAQAKTLQERPRTRYGRQRSEWWQQNEKGIVRSRLETRGNEVSIVQSKLVGAGAGLLI